MKSRPVLALAGGVGGAKLALGLSRILSSQQLTIVVNTGDDETFHGLHVSPDLDTVMYTLSGLANPETGWGLEGDTFAANSMLKRYGVPAWFNLGDKDIGTHLRRTELLNAGWTLSQVTAELCFRLGVRHPVVPMSDGRAATIVNTDRGSLPFQDYFVRLRCEPVAYDIEFRGAPPPSPAFIEALEGAGAIIYCPSNPFLSIAPILSLPGVRERIASFRGPRIAVSPIVGGEALRGPAAKLMGELGFDVSCAGVASWYRGICDTLVMDRADEGQTDAVAAFGLRAEVASTVMVTDDDKTALARSVLELAEGASA